MIFNPIIGQLRKYGLVPSPIEHNNVVKMGLVYAVEPHNKIQIANNLNILDRSLIADIINEINFTKVVDSRRIGSAFNAYMLVMDRKERITVFVLLSEFELISKPKDLSVAFPISKRGEELLRKNVVSPIG